MSGGGIKAFNQIIQIIIDLDNLDHICLRCQEGIILDQFFQKSHGSHLSSTFLYSIIKNTARYLYYSQHHLQITQDGLK